MRQKVYGGVYLQTAWDSGLERLNETVKMETNCMDNCQYVYPLSLIDIFSRRDKSND